MPLSRAVRSKRLNLPATVALEYNRWFSGEVPATIDVARGRSYRIFRQNLFRHIGHISTLAQPKGRFNPECYTLLYNWLLPKEVSSNQAKLSAMSF